MCLARLALAPKVIHKARLTNRSKYPLTTAPALIVQDGQLLGQAMMTYAAVGGQVDVEGGAIMKQSAIAEIGFEAVDGRAPHSTIL